MRGLPLFVAGPIGAVCFGVLLFSSNAVAQAGGPQATITQLNQQAMEAYGNLQFPEAMQLLQQAESLCNQYNLRGPALARTYVNMGMVEFGGSGNNAGALEYFKKAVCLDRSVMLDPLNSTPDVEMLFKGAQSQAQAPGACGGGAAPAPAYPQPQPAYPQPQPAYPQPQPGPATMQLLQHTQVTQQVRLTPIPIFARVNPNVQAGQVILFYRTIGERIYQQVPMQPKGSGYSAMIGCDVMQTFDPTGIEYYIAVLDTANRLLGTSGTEAQPHQTSIVQTLTVPPPALPNESPPGVCREECPPWNPDCNSACKQFGDLCDSDSECCSGLVCIGETCTQTDDDGGGGGGGFGEYGPHFRLSLNAGTGAGLVTGGAEQPYNQVSDGSLTVGTGFAWSKFHVRANPMIYLPVAKLSIGLSFRGDIPMLADVDPAAVSKNRPTPLPLEPSLLLNVAYRIIGSDDHGGFELNALFGLGWMNILNRVSYQDCPPEIASDNSSDTDEDLWGHKFDDGELVCKEDTLDDGKGGWDGSDAAPQNFFRKAGPFGIELGLDGYLWFVDNFGINFGLVADVLMPDFVLNFDIQAGIAVRF